MLNVDFLMKERFKLNKLFFKTILILLCMSVLLGSLTVFADPKINHNLTANHPGYTNGSYYGDNDLMGDSDNQGEDDDQSQEVISDPSQELESTVTYPIIVDDVEQPARETLAYWRNKQKKTVVLTNDFRKNILAVAESQIGYKESSVRYLIEEEGAGRKGYTRYGDFMGSPYCEWCAAFCSFCVYNAGLIDYPREISALRYETLLKSKGYFRAWCQYIPRPGDIVLLSLFPGSKSVSHVGIVEYIEEIPGGDPVLHTIEGNVWDDGVNVARCVRSFDDVVGYGTYDVGIIDENPKLTIRDNSWTKLPYETGSNYNTYSCFPTPYEDVIYYIGGAGLEMYKRIYLSADDTTDMIISVPEDATPIEVDEDEEEIFNREKPDRPSEAYKPSNNNNKMDENKNLEENSKTNESNKEIRALYKSIFITD